MHGPAGIAGSLLSLAPDMAATSMVNRGHSGDLIKLKLALIGKGIEHEMEGRANTPMAKMKSLALNVLSPATAEMYEAGRDLGGPLAMLNSATNNVKTMAAPHIANTQNHPLMQEVNNTINAPYLKKYQNYPVMQHINKLVSSDPNQDLSSFTGKDVLSLVRKHMIEPAIKTNIGQYIFK